MAKRLQSNDLNRRITFQHKQRTEDDAGYPIPGADGWENGDAVWANREPLRGTEFFAASSAQSEITVRYKIWYKQGITADMRLVDLRDNRVYEIVTPLDDPFDDRTETHLLVTEVSNG
ncbi:Phage head-tail joining protein [compost metagenome]